jgi:FkbM family methyltransferase
VGLKPRRPAAYLLTAGCGLLLIAVLPRALAGARLAWLKASGAATHCPWPALLRLPEDVERLTAARARFQRELTVEAEDPVLGAVRIRTRGRSFWLRKDAKIMDGPALLAYLLADHEMMSSVDPNYVRHGDIVIDVGAHVGVFTASALDHGAAKVLMIEPDPVNVECLRRNFSRELASGRVILVPEGAWSNEGTLKLYRGLANSGMNTMVLPEDGAGYVEVKTRPIDQMVAGAGLTRVDFIKMDIEGAERDALRGAARTLARWKPRLMLDAYHQPDDPDVLPAVIRAANPAYQSVCVSCGIEPTVNGSSVRPYLLSAW